MNLRLKLTIFMAIFVAGATGIFGLAQAATPFLSASQTSTNNVVSITVSNADPNALVSLYQQQGSGSVTSISNFGQTNFSGNFTQLASLITDGSNNAVNMYVIVNGWRSNTVTVYPTGTNCYNYCSGGQISLSQSNINLNVGQSGTVLINNYYSGSSYYISSNSNSSVASATLSGNTINIFANTSGSTNILVCQSGSSYQCATLYVTVTGNATGNITFSNANPFLNGGQNVGITIYSSNNSFNNFYVSSNSNSGVVGTSISGNTIFLNALNTGTASIVVCQSGSSYQCGTLYVTVNSGSNIGGWSLAQTSVNLNYGQSSTVSIFNNNSFNTFTVSSNSNPYAVMASVSGNTVSLYGQNIGSSTLVICQNSGGCQNLYVTVGGFNNNSAVTFNNTNPVLNVGQSLNVTINNYNSYYSGYTISSNSNLAVVGATVSGNTLYLNGNAGGTSTVTVCQTGTSNCGSVFVTVNGSGQVLGSSVYPNGSLISENGTIYQVYKNTKVGFSNYPAFTGLGYSLGNVLNVGVSNLIASTFVVNSAFIPHPWGTWIKSGNTIYFVDQNGLIPISDYGIFLNNGGQDRFVVLANSYDLQRPTLSLMSYNDSRLR